ncbi:MAG: MFS transporter [Acidobacteriota bacterium]|nr:MFS transporter [Acidobacteriota bacterium]
MAIDAPSRMNRAQWIFLSLLVLSVCINYIDRGSLGIAGPLLSKELKLDPYEFGKLLSAFFWTYAPMQILSGWLVDRFNVNKVYGAGFLVWSIATLITGSISTAAALLLLRLILGIGESVAYPSYSKIISANFPEHHRGLANGLIDAGSKVGPALGVLLGGLFMVKLGWRFFFWSMGFASLIWLIPWFIWAPKDRVVELQDRLPVPGIFRILKVRSAWGSYLGLLCANYVWYFIVLWLPSYFVNERHYSPSDMAILGSLPFWSVAAASSIGGWLADRVISRGGQPVRVRKAFIAAGLLCSTLILPAAMVKQQTVSLILLSAGCFAFGFFSSNHWALAQTLSGPLASGKWTGLANATGNIPGILAPWFTGWVVRETGEFYYAFVVCAIFAVLGSFFYLFVINCKDTVDWSKV